MGWGAAAAPEVGFLGLLLEVEAHQLAPQEEGRPRAAYGVHQQRQEQRRVDAVQDAREADEIHACSQCM